MSEREGGDEVVDDLEFALTAGEGLIGYRRESETSFLVYTYRDNGEVKDTYLATITKKEN